MYWRLSIACLPREDLYYKRIDTACLSEDLYYRGSIRRARYYGSQSSWGSRRSTRSSQHRSRSDSEPTQERIEENHQEETKWHYFQDPEGKCYYFQHPDIKWHYFQNRNGKQHTSRTSTVSLHYQANIV